MEAGQPQDGYPTTPLEAGKPQDGYPTTPLTASQPQDDIPTTPLSAPTNTTLDRILPIEKTAGDTSFDETNVEKSTAAEIPEENLSETTAAVVKDLDPNLFEKSKTNGTIVVDDLSNSTATNETTAVDHLSNTTASVENETTAVNELSNTTASVEKERDHDLSATTETDESNDSSELGSGSALGQDEIIPPGTWSKDVLHCTLGRADFVFCYLKTQ